MPRKNLKVNQTKSFAKTAKKLKPNQTEDLENAINKIIKDPESGILKSGDLMDVRVIKFKMSNQLTLLAYVYDWINETITLLAVGPHENFYRDLKR
jgi:mRNA-degrading endonuclease RelE of RelBE toxin-antitoxin system